MLIAAAARTVTILSSFNMSAVVNTSLKDYLPLLATGKVREIYAIDEFTLLFVATDRISGACT